MTERPRRRPPPIPSSPDSATSAKKRRTASRGIQLRVENRPLPGATSDLDRLRQEARAGFAGLGVSFLLHGAFLLVLAMLVYSTGAGEAEINGLIASFLSPEQVAREKAAQVRAPVQIASVPNLPNATPSPDAPKPKPAEEMPAPAKAGETTIGRPPKVEKALTGREGTRRTALLQLFGGTKDTEGAVNRGLSWLARVQNSDGRWELHRGYDDPGQTGLRTDTGATALALLCFLGAGETHLQGKHRTVVSKALDWLKGVQKPNGDLHDSEEFGRQPAFYAHGQATIALLEAYAMTRDDSLREPAERALQYIYNSQSELGGWRYQPNSAGDLSVTGWQVMAMQTARMAGLEVPEAVLNRARAFLDTVSSEDGSRYRYQPTDPLTNETAAMTAEGLLCRMYLGWPKDHPALQSGVEYLLKPQHLPRWREGERNVYHWYYATQVMHHLEGDAWKIWNDEMAQVITSNQVRTGKMNGSWHPTRPRGAFLEYGDQAGRLYVTCMCILTLETYYRHLPLYRDADALDAEAVSAVEN